MFGARVLIAYCQKDNSYFEFVLSSDSRWLGWSSLKKGKRCGRMLPKPVLHIPCFQTFESRRSSPIFPYCSASLCQRSQARFEFDHGH